MRKESLWHIGISTLVCIALFAGNSYIEYTNKLAMRTFEVSLSGTFMSAILPIFLGFLITFSCTNAKWKHLKVNWNMLVLQGVPALFLALPWNRIIFAVMQILGISSLDLGPFNEVVNIHNKLGPYYAIAGVWFGKVLADSLFKCEYSEQVLPVENIS